MNAEVLAHALSARKIGSGWIARCPAHDDQHPSLSINEDKDGKVLVHCHAGCEQTQVIDALRAKGLWREGGVHTPKNNASTLQHCSTPPGCSLEQYARAKQLPLEFLRSLGLADLSYCRMPAVRIPYFDAGGAETSVRVRSALEGEQRFRWTNGSKPFLYGLWRLRHSDYVVLVEGESDAHTLWYHDIPALGIPGAANWREDRDAVHLDGIDTVYVVIEADQGGAAVESWLKKSSIRERVRLVTLGQYKDPSSLYLDDPDRFKERFQKALDASITWIEQETLRTDAVQREAWEQCAGLAKQSDLLSLFAAELRSRGVVGEEKTVRVIFLVLISRLLDKPVSAAIKGPSSAGKSFLVDQVLEFFPAESFHALSAMSERALAYSEEPLRHRVLVLFEAAGLQGDFASYLVRSLLSEVVWPTRPWRRLRMV